MSKAGEHALYAINIDNKDTLWYDQAACLGSDTEAFFPEDRGSDYLPEVKRICRGCSVQSECLNFAVKYHVQGYWGGATEQERRRLKRYGMAG
jgi:WhiB family redox-sensing transcriptional regulator